MTRFSVFLLATLALAFNACERHPIAGQTTVVHTHGSNGGREEQHAHGSHDAHGAHGTPGEHAAEGHKAAAGHAEKGHEAPHPAPAPGHEAKHEEKPTFFPEKK